MVNVLFMNFIPELSDNVIIERIESDGDFFVVHEPNSGNRIKINSITKTLLETIDGQKSIEEISHIFNPTGIKNIDSKYVQSIIENLQSFGIIKSNSDIPRKKTHIFFKITLIPQRIVNNISIYLTFPYIKQIYPFIIGCCTTLIVAYFTFLSKSDIYDFVSVNNLLLLLPFTYLSKILHEFGHASALKNSGLEPGSIGFGFYLFIPVFFADVNNSWKLNKQNRMLINIGGMYFQLLFSLLLAIIFIVTQNKWFLIISLYNTLSILPNLNPFIRYDGYWILTDLLKVNNLIKKSEQKFLDVISWVKSPRRKPPFNSGLDYFLLAYFLVNKVLVFMIISLVLFYKKNSLIDFPIIIYSKIVLLSQGNYSITFTGMKVFIIDNFYSIVFYSLLLSFSIRIVKQLYKKINSVLTKKLK